MATAVRLPKLGANMDEGSVVRWLKQPGDRVQVGEPLLEVDTDKAVQEIVSPESGVITEIMVPVGGRAPVGAELCLIAVADGEAAPGPALAATSPPAPASPAARRRARELGVDIAAVKGTGPAGRISVEDVEKAAQKAASEPMPTAQPAVGEALSAIRLQIARRMTKSAREIPQFTVSRTVSIGRVLALKESIRGFSAGGQPLTISLTDFLVQAVARVLRDFPDLNASFAGNPEEPGATVVRHPHVNVGLATDTPSGLLVPVVPAAESLSLAAIAHTRRHLVGRATSGRLLAGDLDGGTFTISNLGPLGVDQFTALVNPPEAAILAVGRVRGQATEADPEKVITLTVSADHRVVDGATAARFLAGLADRLDSDAWELV